ncbi:hypothetical protein GQX74_000976 [Glossina fuscipes]|nr:hypothetical protein GQX74_000976 [Glossina fuscipes]
MIFWRTVYLLKIFSIVFSCILIVQHSLCQDYHEYAKYVVSLRKQREKNFGESHFCAATIIKDDMVLTAANCALQSRHGKPLWHYKVVTGAPIRTIPSDGSGERPWLYFEVYEVSADFERTIDLAIIRVTPIFNLGSDAVAVIQLAMNLYEGGEECYVGGWGDQKIGYDDHISFDKVTLSSDSTCIDTHPTYHFDITCASNSFDPVCKMDWGGPLICSGKLTAVLVGGEYCGEKKPCIYHSVVKYFHWINRTVKELSQREPRSGARSSTLFCGSINKCKSRQIKSLQPICKSAVMKCKVHVQLHNDDYHLFDVATDSCDTLKKTLIVFVDEYAPYSVVNVGAKKYQVRYALRHAEFRDRQMDNIGVIKIREYISTDDVVITQCAQKRQDANDRCTVDDGKFSMAVLVVDEKSCRRRGVGDMCFVYETTKNCDITTGAPILCHGRYIIFFI